MKMKLIIGGSLTLVVLIILIWLCLKFANNGDGEVAVENNAQPESATENSWSTIWIYIWTKDKMSSFCFSYKRKDGIDTMLIHL